MGCLDVDLGVGASIYWTSILDALFVQILEAHFRRGGMVSRKKRAAAFKNESSRS